MSAKWRFWAALVLTAVLINGCGEDKPIDPPAAPDLANARITSVDITPDSLVLLPDSTGDFDAVTDKKMPVRWFSDDPSVATVREKTGLVTAIAPGTARVQAKAGPERDRAPVIVEAVEPAEPVDDTATTDTAVADTTPEPEPTPEPSAGHPNEPAGNTLVARYDGSFLPPSYYDGKRCEQSEALFGCTVAEPSFVDGSFDHRVEQEADGTPYLRIEFPGGQGFPGTGPGYFNLWGPDAASTDWLAVAHDSPSDGHHLREMYLSYRFRFASGQGDGLWELAGGFKPVGYFGISGGTNSCFFATDRASSESEGELRDSFLMGLAQQGPSSVPEDTKLKGWNNWAGDALPVDVVHQIEVVARLNDIGAQNGYLALYRNGVLVHERSDVMWRTAEHPGGFTAVHVNPIIGGADYVRGRTDYIDIFELYVSGEKLGG